jgi:hypothetical protein
MRIEVLPYSEGKTSVSLTPETQAEMYQLDDIATQLKNTGAEFEMIRQWNPIRVSFKLNPK